MLMDLLENLINRVGIILVLAIILSKTKTFKKLVSKRNINIKDKLLLSFIFGGFGIIGTYTGISIQGAIVNSRVIGIVAGGLLGGPLVGILSGIIAGGHRYLIDIGGFTALACAISTVLEGLLAGILRRKLDSSSSRWLFALVIGFLAEIIQMVIILIVAKPYIAAVELVKIIGLPMIFANGIGISVFIMIVDSIFKEIENESVYQAQLALKIADKTLKFFRKGYNQETARETANIIRDMTDIKAVSFTDHEKILAHVGIGEDHHIAGEDIKTELTKRAIAEKDYIIANTKDEIGCEDSKCKLKSAIIVPIKEGEKIIGTLKLYKGEKNSITKVEKELALGLASIFSTQIELSKIDHQRELLSRSELKALQAQINPHFLFNAINTIVSLIRTQPEDARELLMHLGNYFRNNLEGQANDIELHREIENINSYVAIEKARFGDKLEIIYNIPDDINCKIPPLLLQPLVENAIKHGVLEKIEGGRVEIAAYQEDENVRLVVIDNGVGMTARTLNGLFDKTEDDKNNSIGLKNINERLINKYGDEYGLNIESELNQGTVASIIIPNCKRLKGGF